MCANRPFADDIYMFIQHVNLPYIFETATLKKPVKCRSNARKLCAQSDIGRRK